MTGLQGPSWPEFDDNALVHESTNSAEPHIKGNVVR